MPIWALPYVNEPFARQRRMPNIGRMHTTAGLLIPWKQHYKGQFPFSLPPNVYPTSLFGGLNLTEKANADDAETMDPHGKKEGKTLVASSGVHYSPELTFRC